MIDSIRLQNFKGHRDTTVKLGRFTVLVGDNASGKTSVLEAFDLHSQISADSLALIHGDYEPMDLLRRGADGPIRISAVGTLPEAWGTELELGLAPASRGNNDHSWNLKFNVQRQGLSLAGIANGSHNSGTAEGDWDAFEQIAGVASLYTLRASSVSAISYSDKIDTTVGKNGSLTADVLTAMKLGSDEDFQKVEEALRRLIPTVERVRIRRAVEAKPRPKQATRIGNKIFFDFAGAPDVPAHGASQGTLIILALLTILHGPRRPDVIMLDDFDQSLHPRAQIELVTMLKELLALDEFRDLQIVATTHSPYTLDKLDPSDVQAFAVGKDGVVASKRLSEHPEAERVKGSLTTGQLWSLDLERDWVLKE